MYLVATSAKMKWAYKKIFKVCNYVCINMSLFMSHEQKPIKNINTSQPVSELAGDFFSPQNIKNLIKYMMIHLLLEYPILNNYLTFLNIRKKKLLLFLIIS